MNVKARIDRFFKQIRTLQGDPHYIAMGLALGVFMGITPTVPLQTIVAVMLAFILKASKPAAVIGTLTANPITIPVFYIGSYKIGKLLLGDTLPKDIQYESVAQFFKMGTDMTLAMLMGGVLMGVVPGIATYFIALKFFQTVRAKLENKNSERQAEPGNGPPDPMTLPDKQLSPEKP